MDYVTIQGELESKASLFVRYISSSNVTMDEKIAQTVKPMEPPNAIRGLSAARKSNVLVYVPRCRTHVSRFQSLLGCIELTFLCSRWWSINGIRPSMRTH